MDIAFQANLKLTMKRLQATFLSATKGGSGFPMSQLLREYCVEYFSRIGEHGAGSMPTSFNVVEAFLELSKVVPTLILRSELEYLIHLEDYLEWYTSDKSNLSRDPNLLVEVMKDAAIYSYELLGGFDQFVLKIAGSEIGIVGMSLVRHGNELSVILLAGETPPSPPDFDIVGLTITGIPKGKENVKPSPELSAKDRFVLGKPDHGRVILMCRIDVYQRRFEVRYANVDVGQSFLVYTDDEVVLKGVSDQEARSAARDGLGKYREAFSFIADLIYLPVYMLTRSWDTSTTTFLTELHELRKTAKAREAVDLLGPDSVAFYRSVHCLPRNVPTDSLTASSNDSLNVRKTGRWLALSPSEIGRGEDGTSIVGKTWVSSYESWTSDRPEALLFAHSAALPLGPDPGTIYVMRSPSHTKDLYKIGLTRRNTETRASEISSATGVPLPMSILANWDVSSCEEVERRVHVLLARYRTNDKREFFLAPLPIIIRSIEDVIAGLGHA